MKKILKPHDFKSKNTPSLAKFLLGKILVCEYKNRKRERMITEVEAYDGPNDRASHASHGETSRNKIMFGPPGFWYVYFVYGMHHMLNIVTGPKGYPAAILIRGVSGIAGPGRVTSFFGITKDMWNRRSAVRQNGLYIVDRGIAIPHRDIISTPRIGVSYAGPKWARRHLRFFVRGNNLQQS